MFLFDVLGIGFKGVKHIFFLGVVVLLFLCLEKTVLSVSCVCIIWVRCLLCSRSSYFVCVCISGCLVVFWVLLLWNALRHLGIVGIIFSSLLCPDVASSTSCLGCSFVCVGFLGFLFLGTLSGGRLGMANREGVNICFGFSHNRGVWVKTGAVPEGEGSLQTFLASKTCIFEVEKHERFSILSQELLEKLGFQSGTFAKDTWSARFGGRGAGRRPQRAYKPYKNRGFAGYGQRHKEAQIYRK